MANSAVHRALDQRAGIDRVVAIIAERIADRLRNDDRSGEVNDGVDAMLADQPLDQRLIAAVADNERHALGDRPGKAGRQIVEHHHRLAGVGEFEHHMAADIAGSAGDQDRHA